MSGMLPPLSFSSQSLPVTCAMPTIASMLFSREMDCRLDILRALNEAWEGVVDRNLSRFNQLVSNCRSSWLLGEQNRGNSPHPNPLPVGEGACLRLDGGCGLARFCLDPPPSCRVELNGSGAPSGMTAQSQLVQGCTICGVPSDPESEARETAVGGRLGGGEDLW